MRKEGLVVSKLNFHNLCTTGQWVVVSGTSIHVLSFGISGEGKMIGRRRTLNALRIKQSVPIVVLGSFMRLGNLFPVPNWSKWLEVVIMSVQVLHYKMF